MMSSASKKKLLLMVSTSNLISSSGMVGTNTGIREEVALVSRRCVPSSSRTSQRSTLVVWVRRLTLSTPISDSWVT